MRAVRIRTWIAGWFLLGALVASLVTCHAAAQGPCPFNPFATYAGLRASMERLP